MRRLNLIKSAKINTEQFLSAYHAYLEQTQATYRMSYENFLESPTQELRRSCEALEVTFDHAYENKWYLYDKITGDLNNSSSLRDKPVIAPRPRREFNQELLNEFNENDTYHKILNLITDK